MTGSVLLPPGDGPFPGVVIIHGSGASARSNPWTTAHAEALAQRGVAVLHPDKRGSGSSGGDWKRASFLDLADDAVAAVEILRKHPKVDPKTIGVMGFSQGGHIAPAAATRSPHIAFVISVSGSVVPILEQIEDELMLMSEKENLTTDQTAIVRRLHDLGAQYAQSKIQWGAYSEALQRAKAGPLTGKKIVEGFPSAPDSPAWEFARAVGPYDPMEYWRQVKVPAVFVYGGNDDNVRVSKSVGRIQEVFNPLKLNYVVVLFGQNGHALYRADELDYLSSWIRAGGKG